LNFASAGAGALTETNVGMVCDLASCDVFSFSSWDGLGLSSTTTTIIHDIVNLNKIIFISLLKTIGLKTQLSFFKYTKKHLNVKLGEAKTKTLLSRALYMFSIGSSDYITFATHKTTELPSYTRDEYVKTVIGNLTDAIQVINMSW
jgi:hypothetical protein